MYGVEREGNRIVVFDVSLLAPDSLALVQALLEEDNLTFVATRNMLKIFSEIDSYKGLLQPWSIDSRYAGQILEFPHCLKFFEKVKAIDIKGLPEKKGVI